MRPALLLALALLLSGCTLLQRETAGPSLPDSIAVLGDSISRATNVKGDSFGDQPVHSWATGTDRNDSVESHFERLRDLGADIVPFNDARAGARASDLPAQAQKAVDQRAEYVVVLIGANDVCAQTPLDAFRADVRRAFDTLEALEARVLVASIPNVAELWRLFGDNDTARAVWRAFDVCPAILASGDDWEAKVARIDAYNDILEEEAGSRQWWWDGGLVFTQPIRKEDVSTVDYFHPSVDGQARLADATWRIHPAALWENEMS